MDEQKIIESLIYPYEAKKDKENSYRIYQPFMFLDGDHLSINIKKENNKWLFTDYGHTLFHLGHFFEMDETDEEFKMIQCLLLPYEIEDRETELLKEVEFNSRISLSFYIQGLLRLVDFMEFVYETGFFTKDTRDQLYRLQTKNFTIRH